MDSVRRQELSTVLTNLRGRLEGERRRLGAEIGAYPRPIAGCDVQFNHLLEQRARIGRALRALDGLMSAPERDGLDAQESEAILAVPEVVGTDLMKALRRAVENAAE